MKLYEYRDLKEGEATPCARLSCGEGHRPGTYVILRLPYWIDHWRYDISMDVVFRGWCEAMLGLRSVDHPDHVELGGCAWVRPTSKSEMCPQDFMDDVSITVEDLNRARDLGVDLIAQKRAELAVERAARAIAHKMEARLVELITEALVTGRALGRI